MVYGDWELIDKPEPYFDENWYNNNFDNTQFNELISENLYEYLN
jgi:hypothetical protein